MQLRDYQKDLYAKTQLAFREGNRRVLVQSPCGSGKTVLATYMAAKAQNRGKTVWVILPRIEIMSQTEECFKACGVERHNIYIGMAITTANLLGSLSKPDLVIFDECHLSMADTYLKIVRAYPEAWIVGLSASPCRSDNRPLGSLYDTMVKGVTVRWLIEHQRLAPYRYYSVPIYDTEGEVVDAEAARMVEASAVFGKVVDSWKRFADGKQTVVYCASVKHSKDVCKAFTDAGVKAVHMDGTTPAEERAKTVERFRNGEITVLCNCDLISMGFDMPDIGCVMLCRPTQSLSLYIQQSGRALRYKPDKTAVIIDAVGNYTRFPMPDEDIEWSLTRQVKMPARINKEGNFTVRVCPNCFMTFKAADRCPFCDYPYPLSPRELQAHEDIRLEEITREQAEAAERERKRKRQEVGRAKTEADLWKIARERGYKAGWVYRMLSVRKRHG